MRYACPICVAALAPLGAHPNSVPRATDEPSAAALRERLLLALPIDERRALVRGEWIYVVDGRRLVRIR